MDEMSEGREPMLRQPSSDSDRSLARRPSEDLDKLLLEDIPAWTKAGCRIQRVFKFSTVVNLAFSHHGIVVLIGFPCKSTLYLQIELLNEGIRHNVSKKNPIDTAVRLNWIKEKAVDVSPQVIVAAIEDVKSRHHTYLLWNCQVFAEHMWGACAGKHKCQRRDWLERRLYEFFVRDSLVKKLQVCKTTGRARRRSGARSMATPRRSQRCVRGPHGLASALVAVGATAHRKGPEAFAAFGDGCYATARGLKCTLAAFGMMTAHRGSSSSGSGRR